MTTFLYSIIGGWTLTAIAVGVVFLALLILYGVYSMMGEIFCGRFRRKARAADKGAAADEETAAAIAVALALHEIGSSRKASPTGTVSPSTSNQRHVPSPWADKSLTFRKSPK